MAGWTRRTLTRGGAASVAARLTVLAGAASRTENPHISFIGNSWTRGTGATNLYGYAGRSVTSLGYEHTILGVGGSGYARGGSGNIPFGERITAAPDAQPDVLIMQGSINDRVVPTPELRTAMWTVLGNVKKTKPAGTRVVVVGASYVPGLTKAAVDRTNTLLESAATGLGFRYVDVAGESWTSPTRSSTWADPYHPDSSGHQRIAEKLKPILAAEAAK